MKKPHGIRVGRKLLSIWRWVRSRRRQAKRWGYLRLASTTAEQKRAATAKIFDWGRLFSLLKPTKGDEVYGDYQLLREPPPKAPPKGHLAVYLDVEDGEMAHRVVVPVVFFNHPLFAELLKKAEREFGYEQSGGITIPCPVSDFEGVCTVVAAEVRSRRSSRSRGLHPRRLFSLNPTERRKHSPFSLY